MIIIHAVTSLDKGGAENHVARMGEIDRSDFGCVGSNVVQIMHEQMRAAGVLVRRRESRTRACECCQAHVSRHAK